MTRRFEPYTHWAWLAPISRVQSAAPSGPIVSKLREEVMKRTWILLAMALLSVTGCPSTSADSAGTLFVSGRIDGDTVDISSKRPGRITEITVREGDSVHAAQLMGVIARPQDEATNEAP